MNLIVYSVMITRHVNSRCPAVFGVYVAMALLLPVDSTPTAYTLVGMHAVCVNLPYATQGMIII